MDTNRAEAGRRMPIRCVWLTVVCVVTASVVAAQPVPRNAPPDIASDRPGFNAPAAVIPRGGWQLELGWAHSGGDDGGSDAPEPMLRVGVAPRLELQVGGLGFETACDDRCRWYASDIMVGARHVLAVTPFDASVAVTGAVSLPVGASAVSAGHVEPSFILHVDRDLVGSLALSYNYLVAHEHDDDDRAAWRHGHGLSLEYGLGGWTPYVGLARRPTRGRDGVPWLAQVGTTRRLGNHMQADVTVDMGLTRAEPAWGIAAGFVVRRLAVDRTRRAQ